MESCKGLLAMVILMLAALAACDGRDRKLYDDAQRLWSHERYEEAVSKLKLLADEYPDSRMAPKALFRIGEIYYLNIEDPEKSLEYLARAAEEGGRDGLSVKAREYMAEIYENSLDEFDLAIAQYHKIIAGGGEDVEKDMYQSRVAAAYFKKGDYAQAIIEYQSLIERYPETALKKDALYHIASLKFLSGEPEAALKVYKKLLEDGPEAGREYDIRMGIGACHEEMEHLEDALREYEAALKAFPGKELIERKMESVKKRMEKKLG